MEQDENEKGEKKGEGFSEKFNTNNAEFWGIEGALLKAGSRVAWNLFRVWKANFFFV